MTPQLPEQLELANKRNVFVSRASASLSSSDQFDDNRETFLRMSKWLKESERKGCQFLIKIPEFLAFTFYSISLFQAIVSITWLYITFGTSFLHPRAEMWTFLQFKLPIRLFSDGEGKKLWISRPNSWRRHQAISSTSSSVESSAKCDTFFVGTTAMGKLIYILWWRMSVVHFPWFSFSTRSHAVISYPVHPL